MSHFRHEMGPRGSPQADTLPQRSHRLQEGFKLVPRPPGSKLKIFNTRNLKNIGGWALAHLGPGPTYLGPGPTWALGPLTWARGPLGPRAHLGPGPTWAVGPLTWARGPLGPWPTYLIDNFGPELGCRLSSRGLYTGKLHRISTRIQWEYSLPKTNKKNKPE